MSGVITSSTEANIIKPLPLFSENQPKQVILRLRVDGFEGEGRNWEQYVDAIQAYLTWAGRPMSEYDSGPYETRKHFTHVEPFQDPELQQTTFHVVLDMEQDMLNEPNLDTIPHEIYRVCRDKEGNLYDQLIPLFKYQGLLSTEKSVHFKIPGKPRT
jgi:hypothetical protein